MLKLNLCCPPTPMSFIYAPGGRLLRARALLAQAAAAQGASFGDLVQDGAASVLGTPCAIDLAQVHRQTQLSLTPPAPSTSPRCIFKLSPRLDIRLVSFMPRYQVQKRNNQA